ncbi:MAG TPA: c-type cytochrome [Rhizomicrobium sp.]|nr:c-type cytochrome [Rhizomicrobium sp.]
MKKTLFAALAFAPLLVWGVQAQNATAPAKSPFAAGTVWRDLVPLMAKPVAPFEWAYPVGPANLPRPDPHATFTAQGADPSIKLTARQISDAFGPPDWYPKEHAPLPQIVAHGRSPHVPACTLCHLPNGNGHPESASIAGLTSAYIIQQMHAFRDGERTNIRAPNMIEMALDISDRELRDAANYFAHIPRAQQQWIRVVETSRAPASHVGAGGARFFDKGAQTVPVAADMIYEVAESEEVELRNDHVGFVDYVPMGSLAKGRIVAMGNRGQMRTCGSCHGDDYRGHDDAPRIGGRSAYYLIRQLADMRSGVRKGSALGKMKDVVDKLSDADILNVAAYMASRAP